MRRGPEVHSPTGLWASLAGVMTASRRTSAWQVAALLAASIAALVGLGGPGPASAALAACAYDHAAYSYDACARLSSSDSVAREARGSPSGSATALCPTRASSR